MICTLFFTMFTGAVLNCANNAKYSTQMHFLFKEVCFGDGPVEEIPDERSRDLHDHPTQ